MVSTSRRSSIGAVLADIEAQRNGVKTVVEGIARVGESSKKVLDVATLILDVSDKTDLLAMNASIEAAHAGASGRGFAIISGEIRKLSDEVKRGASAISAALSENNKLIAEAETSIRAFATGIEGSLGEVRMTLGSMEEIISGLSEMETATEELNSATDSLMDIAKRTEEGVTKMAESVDAGAEGIAGISSFSVELYAAAHQMRERFASIETSLSEISGVGKRNLAQIAELGAGLKAVDATEGS